MRGTKRRRKLKPNYKRIVGALLILIILILLAILGIRNIVKNHSQSQAENNNYQGQEEVIIPEDITINLVAIGDIMCHSQNFKTAYNATMKTYDFSPAFRNIAKYISKADIAIRKS